VPFPLLSDPGTKIHASYKVINALDEAGVKRLEGFGIDVERWSKRKHHKMAIPAIFLIDKGGVIRLAHAAHDYKTRPNTKQLLQAIRALEK
jgi:peroxiredoxin